VKINTFEEIESWKQAKEMTVHIYTLFSKNTDYGFCDQLQRASVSIMNNIAEGFERKSDKELSHFLFIAKGSAGEVRSMLILAKELSYISDDSYTKLVNQCVGISKKISAFISSLKTA
jgi:four helix bundle protein